MNLFNKSKKKGTFEKKIYEVVSRNELNKVKGFLKMKDKYEDCKFPKE